MAFPPYRRSHLRSQTYHTLVRIFSHLSPSTAPTHPLNTPPDNANGRMGQENQENEPECSEVMVGSDFVNPKDSVPRKEIHEVHETIERVEDKSKGFSTDEMVLDDIQLLMRIEEPSSQTNGFHMEQKLMDELKLVVNGTEDPVCDNDLIPLNSGLGEKPNSASEADLMDYQLEHVEFLHSDANTSGNASELQVPGKLNQLASEGFHPSLMFDVSTSTKEQASASVISTSGLKHETQQKEETELVKSVCAVVGSRPTTEEGEFEKKGQNVQKVAEAAHISLDLDMNTEALNVSEDGGLLDSTILKDKHETQNGEKLEKLISENNATNSSNIMIEEGDVEDGEISGGDAEDGEISGDFEMDGNSFDVSSADALILEQMKVDGVQKPKNVIGNMVYPCKIGNGEMEEGYQSNSFMVNTLQDANINGQVKPRTGVKNGIACGIELATSRRTIEFDKAGEYSSVLKPENSRDRHVGSNSINDMPTSLTHYQDLYGGFLEETTTKEHENSSAVKMVGASRKKKRCRGKEKKKDEKEQVTDANKKRKVGPDSEEKEDKEKMVDASRSKNRGGSQEKKDKYKMKYRKQRAEKNRELGVKRLKLLPIQKPKTISYCRHYIKGRCYEGDKCQFSHDTVPTTKSTPCFHFARHSCMKGDDCPFDHELSKYPCNNFVSKGFCSRGDTCLFSHQVPTNQDIPTPSNVCTPKLKSPLLSGNTNFSVPPNNHGCSSVQQNHSTNSKGVYSHVNAEHKVTDTSQKQPTSAPKGIRFINVAKSSPSPSTPKQDTVTPNKGSLVQKGTCADQGASGTTPKTIVEIPEKFPAVTPKGVNFLSFGGKGPVCSFKSPISSHVNKENSIKLPQLVNFGLSEQASSSLNKDDSGKVCDGAKQNVPQTNLFSNEITDKNQSMAEGMKSKFPEKASIGDSMRDHSHCKSVQEGKKASDNSQASSVTSTMLRVRPFVSHQSSQCLVYHKQASNLGQRALLSTLAFAAEHESDIKMKFPSGASPV